MVHIRHATGCPPQLRCLSHPKRLQPVVWEGMGVKQHSAMCDCPHVSVLSVSVLLPFVLRDTAGN